MTEGYPPDERETTAEREDTDALLDRAQETPPVGDAPDRPCGRCHDHTAYEWAPVEGWVSVCCGAPPASEEAPPWMEND